MVGYQVEVEVKRRGEVPMQIHLRWESQAAPNQRDASWGSANGVGTTATFHAAQGSGNNVGTSAKFHIYPGIPGYTPTTGKSGTVGNQQGNICLHIFWKSGLLPPFPNNMFYWCVFAARIDSSVLGGVWTIVVFLLCFWRGAFFCGEVILFLFSVLLPELLIPKLTIFVVVS